MPGHLNWFGVGGSKLKISDFSKLHLLKAIKPSYKRGPVKILQTEYIQYIQFVSVLKKNCTPEALLYKKLLSALCAVYFLLIFLKD